MLDIISSAITSTLFRDCFATSPDEICDNQSSTTNEFSSLKKADIKLARLDGSMTLQQRNAALKLFSDDPDVSVLLISLRYLLCYF
jgi:hypothetical protein